MGPNYISYSDWEQQASSRRKRRHLVAWIVFVVIGVAALAVTAYAINAKLKANEKAFLMSLPPRINDDDDNPRSDLIATGQPPIKTPRSPRQGVRISR